MTTWRKQPWTWAKTAVGVAVVATLAACGGGGGSSSTPPSTSTASVSGVASKGLMRNAVVSAYAVKADGTVDRSKALATDRTDNAGLYELRGLPAGQVVVIEVVADDQTRMDDEATGAVITPVARFTMRAAAVPEAGGTASVQVTPFSEMAVAIAEKNAGGLKADTVAAANAQVVLFVGGTDVLKDKPEFDPDTKAPLNAAAVALAAVSKLAERGGLGCGVPLSQLSAPGRVTAAGAVIAAPAAPAPADQAAAVKCVVEQLAALGTKDDDTSDGTDVVAELESSRQDIIAQVGYTGTVPPVQTADTVAPSTISTTVAGYIRDAKALITSLRTTGATLSNKTEPTAITTRLKSVGDAFDSAVAPLDSSSWTQIVTAMAGTFVIDSGPWIYSELMVDSAGRFNLLNTSADLPGQSQNVPVTCRFADATFSATVPSGPTNQLICRATYAVREATAPLPAGVGSSNTNVAFQHHFRLKRGTDDSMTIESRLVRQFGTINSTSGVFEPSTVATDALPVAGGDKAFRTATATRTCERSDDVITSCNAFGISGEMAAGLHFEPGVGYSSRGTHQQIALNFASSATGTGNTLTKLATTAEFKVMSGTTRLSTVAIKNGSEIIAKTATPGNVYNVSSALADMENSSAKFIVEAVAPNGATLTGTLSASSFIPDGTGRAVPTLASFQGVIKEAGGAALFDGTLTATMPDYLQLNQGNNWSLGLNGTLITSGTNTLTLNATLTQEQYDAGTGKRKFGLAGTYSENGTQKVILSGTVNEITPSESALRFSTPSGVAFTVTSGATSIPIAKGRDSVGVYDVDKSLLVYADNSYERF